MDYRIFDTLLEPVFVLNSESKVVYCNEPASILTGLSVRKVQRAGSFFEIFQFGESKLQETFNLANIKDATPYIETTFKTENETAGRVQITCQPVPQSEAPEWLVYFRDVTLEETLQKKYRAELEGKESVIKDLEKAQIELQHYSKNLEKMVDERTAELSKLNQHLSALLDSLGQGFFVFNKEGQCLDIHSKACEATIECNPSGMKVWEVLKLPQEKVPGFEKWMFTVFAEMLPFPDLAVLGPMEFPHSEGRNISLEYYPMRNSEDQIEGVVVVATDISSLVAAQNAAESERAHVKMILSLIRSKKEVAAFIKDSNEMLAELDQHLHLDSHDSELLYRIFHTLKGGAASFSIQDLATECHAAEELLSTYKLNPKSVTREQLFATHKAVAEKFQLFLEHNKDILGKSMSSKDRIIEADFTTLNKYYHDLQILNPAISLNFLDEVLFEPIGQYFKHYDEVIEQVALELNKEVLPLKIEGGDLRVLPEPYTRLFSALVHAIRNSLDHGIESSEERFESGKNSAGLIQIRFEKKGQSLEIIISDDGKGIDPSRIRAKLESKGFSHSNESDEQVIQHIFDSDFSTKTEITALSGRGVGMDAIKEAAEALGGKVHVTSEMKKGTRLTITTPFITKT
jgi:two-component system, chemotaxis family, sensor kinase CheA